ncbi:MAG: type II toxin-antitoxin system Phd/YefM family antitoxin [Anaerolineales bacterium]|nr:MAG: type II toxin-antitoxin system Phd/YefM family antitoxin [Anaerolineales bacterium]
MSDVWQLQEAKNKFSEVVNKALSRGPQYITRRGEQVVVILSASEFQQLQKSKPTLSEFFRRSPFVGIDLDLERDQSYPRDVDL